MADVLLALGLFIVELGFGMVIESKTHLIERLEILAKNIYSSRFWKETLV